MLVDERHKTVAEAARAQAGEAALQEERQRVAQLEQQLLLLLQASPIFGRLQEAVKNRRASGPAACQNCASTGTESAASRSEQQRGASCNEPWKRETASGLV